MIKFVREYENHGKIFEVVYESRRCRTFFGEDELPATVKKFMATAKVTKQYDYTATRKDKNEILYQ